MCILFIMSVSLFVRYVFFFLMIRRPPRSTRTDTLFPYTTLFRSNCLEGYSAASEIRVSKMTVVTVGKLDRTWHFDRSEEHTSELQSLMRISYAVFCLKKKNTHTK